MLSLKQLVVRANTLLRTQPILWTPPLAIALFTSLMIPTGAAGVSVLVSGLITLAVTAGWYALIASAEADQKPEWDAFFVAIGRHFSGLLMGTLAFFGLVAAVVVPLLLAGAYWVGPAMLTRIQTELPALMEKAQNDPKILLAADPALVLALDRLLVVVLVAVLWYGLVTLGLIVWKQALVLRNLPWWEAFRDSLAVLKAHFGLFIGVLSLQAFGYLGAAFLSVLPFPIGVFGWMLMIAIHVWSTIALTVLYLHARPEAKSLGEGSASPTGQPT